MSHSIIDHSPDLRKLHGEGYALEVRGAYALVHDIPYVNSEGKVQFGTLVSNLAMAGNITTKPEPHTAYFIGEHPCNKDGSKMMCIANNSNSQNLGDGIIVGHMFSVRPRDGYVDYYEKFVRYITLISGPAQAIKPGVTAKTYRKDFQVQEHSSVFCYEDTNSNKAGIAEINRKVETLCIGIIGLGGTGSYVLDLLAKTSVREIHLIDGDLFLQHNAFRCPGAPSLECLQDKPRKVEYLKNIYDNMRREIVAHAVYLEENCVELLENLDFVFLCIDNGHTKKIIIEALQKKGKPFIDVGMHIDQRSGVLDGNVRTTLISPKTYSRANDFISLGAGENDDVYRSNIQIAELNALNACIAVIQWKKYYGIYADYDSLVNTNFAVGTNSLTKRFVVEEATEDDKFNTSFC